MKLAAAVLLALALVTPAQAQSRAHPLQSTPRDQLMATDRAFSRLSERRGRAYAFLTMATNNAHLFGAGDTAPVYGRAQAFRALSRRENGRMRWEPLVADVSPDGRMGWTDGRWEIRASDGAASRTGNYLTVWTKDRRGTWRVQASMNTATIARK